MDAYPRIKKGRRHRDEPLRTRAEESMIRAYFRPQAITPALKNALLSGPGILIERSRVQRRAHLIFSEDPQLLNIANYGTGFQTHLVLIIVSQ